MRHLLSYPPWKDHPVGIDHFRFLKVCTYHWIPCTLNLLGKTTCLERSLFLDNKGGHPRQVPLYCVTRWIWIPRFDLVYSVHFSAPSSRTETLEKGKSTDMYPFGSDRLHAEQYPPPSGFQRSLTAPSSTLRSTSNSPSSRSTNQHPAPFQATNKNEAPSHVTSKRITEQSPSPTRSRRQHASKYSTG